MREGVRAQRCSSGRGRWCTSAADADGGFKDRLFAVCDGEGEVVADPEFELGIVVVLGRWGSGCRRAWLSEGLL